MTNNELLMRALQERRAKGMAMQQLESDRQAEVARLSPRIAQLRSERQQTIDRALEQALAGHAADVEERVLAQNSEIRQLLKEAGLAEDYLEPQIDCEYCQDSGYEGEAVRKLCRCVKDRYLQLLNASAMEAGDETFENYDDLRFPATLLQGQQVSQRAYTRVIRDVCERYANSLPLGSTQNLLLYGGSGLGKTFLLKSIAARAGERGVQALSLTANSLLNQIRQHYFSREQAESPHYEAVQLLLIDDLGTEPLWENITVEQLFALIDLRLQKGLYTVISTNLGLGELKSRYTERIMSRLLDVRKAQKLAFLGEDIRLLKPQQTGGME